MPRPQSRGLGTGLGQLGLVHIPKVVVLKRASLVYQMFKVVISFRLLICT